MADFFKTSVEYLKGIGPQKAILLNKELNIYNYGDMLRYFPFRYEDRTKIHPISAVTEYMDNVLVKGVISRFELVGQGRKQRLVGHFGDGSGQLQLVWFQGIRWVQQRIKAGVEYLVYGKPNKYGSNISIAHPDVELVTIAAQKPVSLQAVYPLTEGLRKKFIDNKSIRQWMLTLATEAKQHITEVLPTETLRQYSLLDRAQAYYHIHAPSDQDMLQKAKYRLKFEELFFLQLDLLNQKQVRLDKFKGLPLSNTSLLKNFYDKDLPFPLTEAQKRVIKEIFADMKSGYQMNRLLQGDVGSGKTMVAFCCMLLAAGSGAQAILMAPTEILAQQHFNSLLHYAAPLELKIDLLTGATKKKKRQEIHESLLSGDLHFLIGTHALLEEAVQFKKLGLAVIDEQHRFGVAQRARLWQKNKDHYPHVLVMTATPIPRTLSMTVYGDLEVSIIDEMPAGRKPIQTVHRYDSNRLRVYQFLRDEIKKGRQIYIVYPLIEESEKLDLKDLQDGYESVCRAFPNVPVSIVHGRMKADDKTFEMDRFVKGETKIMVATTVIEVGVNVPNASVMIIENAERFGLSQLHQLRGRVGRGAEQSYCILMSGFKLSAEARTRLETMVRSNDGFEIANVDLQLRGPGDMMGTRQSGQLGLVMADLREDGQILTLAREAAKTIIKNDPKLELPSNLLLKNFLKSGKKNGLNWSRIS